RCAARVLAASGRPSVVVLPRGSRRERPRWAGRSSVNTRRRWTRSLSPALDRGELPWEGRPMRGPAFAIPWGVWARHRWAFLASAGTLLAMAVAYPLLFARVSEPAAILASVLPPVVVFGFVMNALLFVDDHGSVAAGYPRRMLALPVSTN